MLEKILSAYVSETLQIPIWTIVLATVCLLWLLHNGRKQVNTKVCYRIYTSPKSNRNHHDSWIYNYLFNHYLSPLTLWVRILLRWGVLDITLCDKVCQW